MAIRRGGSEAEAKDTKGRSCLNLSSEWPMEGIAAAGWFGGGNFIEKEVRAMSDLWKPEIRQANPSTSFAGPATEHATIGRSIVIKGEVSGQEALFVDGTVEGPSGFPITACRWAGEAR
jgi:hypothetical protein